MPSKSRPGFDEQEAGVLRQILQCHNVGRAQLAEEVEGTGAFPGIPQCPYGPGRPQKARPGMTRGGLPEGCFHSHLHPLGSGFPKCKHHNVKNSWRLFNSLFLTIKCTPFQGS